MLQVTQPNSAPDASLGTLLRWLCDALELISEDIMWQILAKWHFQIQCVLPKNSGYLEKIMYPGRIGSQVSCLIVVLADSKS